MQPPRLDLQRSWLALPVSAMIPSNACARRSTFGRLRTLWLNRVEGRGPGAP